ncbi:MAG: 1-deoxy-D-xylulose-5-phosphate reductoisomerase [Actinomycetota bacterium]|nr:1-deoxy-D-xylulose-5-phosphate reductoisomerase [Actinomycetota bacterium]MDK1017344.1 1-deoxy-D-xylulose-5-phosphate reductoisomerase [Actinomycetota bacterium]MDK1026773.1 1-deoxy-D-xylulose-5-phosphate reductoisomerase [Actinomycetota bacterium]MDK1038856.1 1-deoxy-D-xylulose-5-phosphate reductoisomerase [Actinomycetota bacterium]MDK1096351.1 1-deoxy-D-xylulose-5-phosphate reductoisomerase [Actinomycetota bacterium]
MGRYPLKPLVVLGATGSIGMQTLEVAERVGASIHAIAANRASQSLHDLAVEYPEAIVCVASPGEARERFEAEFGNRVRFGPEAFVVVAATPGSVVVNGVVGAAGLRPSLAALGAGNRLALANKESLVSGGPLMLDALASGGGELIPVDSEHSAIWQCLVGESSDDVKRLILTASGGPFRGMSAEELASVTIAEALDHPTWSMGPRITTDSATLMNKAFEVIEAHYLFGVEYDDIDVVVHPESVVHSFVEFVDGVVKAEIGPPDMRKPLQYAITGPTRVPAGHTPFDPIATTLTFEAPDRAAFPCLDLGYEAGRIGGTATAVLNAADEIAVEAFLAGRIRFVDIAGVVDDVLGRHTAVRPRTVEDVEAADAEARVHASEVCAALMR